jgi:hypothetical protein
MPIVPSRINKYFVYSTVALSVGAFGVTTLKHPHAHIVDPYDTTPVRSGPLLATTTSSASSTETFVVTAMLHNLTG